MTRNEFRSAVFARDRDKCVICQEPAKDAHHIMERRLFSDGGYHIDNGAALCKKHHIQAEQTILTCEQIRNAAGISRVVLPEHLYKDSRYDKWGNQFIGNNRIRGDLFDDISVQRILPEEVKVSFVKYIKYPRTYHLPWSPGRLDDDRAMDSVEQFFGQDVVVTAKMDGENTTMYPDYLHARSIASEDDQSKHWVKGLHGSIAWSIPDGWRVCGENLYAKHSIAYSGLPSFFMGFSVWDKTNTCLAWDDTEEYLSLLGLEAVPVLYRGMFDETKIKRLYTQSGPFGELEGYVMRLAGPFHYKDFRKCVGKYVRANHVQTNQHWKRTWTMNNLHVKPVNVLPPK